MRSTSRRPLGERVLQELLRRLNVPAQLDRDVILVQQHPALDSTRGTFVHANETWRFVPVKGELELRSVLPRRPMPGSEEVATVERVVAMLPPGATLPVDLRGLAFKHKVIELRTDEDVIPALAGRPCAPLHDPELEAAVLSRLDRLDGTTGSWTLGPTVQRSEVREMVLSAVLGRQRRLSRVEPGTLLGEWLLEPPDVSGLEAIVLEALTDAHGLQGRWLGQALVDGLLDALLVAGALAAGIGNRSLPEPRLELLRAELERESGVPGAVLAALTGLAQGASRDLWLAEPRRLVALLQPAEEWFRRHGDDPKQFALLGSALDARLEAAADRAASGQPESDLDLRRLEQWMPARERGVAIEAVRAASRLARFCTETDISDRPLSEWGGLHRSSVAWADRAARVLRRALDGQTARLRSACDKVLGRYLDIRDGLNEAFAIRLSQEWSSAAFSKDPASGLALNQVAGSLLAPMLAAGRSLFLVVLDGADVSSVLELCEGFDEDVGLVGPGLSEDNVGLAELNGLPSFGSAWAVPPTVTNRSRRALFAGAIPENPALDDAELKPADAKTDHKAFTACRPLEGFSRRLFLKGELRDGGKALVASLRSSEHALVAAVFNGIDDALSSKETTAFARWEPRAVGSGFVDAVDAAIGAGRLVIITSDHGHTPFLSIERKVPGRGKGKRFGGTAVDGSVELGGAAVPGGPVHCLSRVGAYYGQQTRGFHGGVGLEEMVVPLAFLGAVQTGTGRPSAPGWWWDTGSEPEIEPGPDTWEALPETEPAPILPAVELAPPVAPRAPSWLEGITDPGHRRALLHLQEFGHLNEAEAVRLMGGGRALRRFTNRLDGYVAVLPFKVRVEPGAAGGKTWVKE